MRRKLPVISFTNVSQQVEVNLPTLRTTPSLPFTHTGVDDTPSIQINTTKSRENKSYKGYIMVVFAYFSSKSIHLKAVSDMTAEAFLVRKESCAHVNSDVELPL